jgi:hypothetical protein
MNTSVKSPQLIKSPLNRNFLKISHFQNPYQKKSKKNFLPMPMSKSLKEQEQAYRVLLAKRHDVFSTDKNDLGWANHFEHKITTKNENPTYRKQFPIPEAHREGLENRSKTG